MNIRTKEISQQIIAAGNKDPLLTLSEIQATDQDSAVRATAANMLATYLHSKLHAVPAPRYIEHPIDVPDFTSVEIAKNFLARIPVLVARGELYQSSD